MRFVDSVYPEAQLEQVEAEAQTEQLVIEQADTIQVLLAAKE